MKGLPEHVRRLADAWGFVATEELPGGHCSRVFANETRVLKAPFQGEELTFGVPAALKLASVGGPEVYEHDVASGAILMERLRPGRELSTSTLSESEAQGIFVELTSKIAGLSADSAMQLRDYHAFRHPLLDRLEETTTSRVFLHGDLHHHNILSDSANWRPIDPKGLAGDPHFECIAFLRNPVDQLKEVRDLAGFTETRIHSLARALDLDPWRIAAWGLLDNIESTSPPDHPWGRLGEIYRELELRLRSG